MADVRTNLLGAFDLADTGIAMMRMRLRRAFPSDTEEEIDRRLAAWLATRPGAEDGDGVGRPGRWPRQG